MESPNVVQDGTEAVAVGSIDAPAKASALDVADYFIALAAAEEDEPDYLSPLRLQKLLYYAQAWSLATRGRPLFNDAIEAWTHGPVIRSVYARFADLHDGPIQSSRSGNELTEEDKEFVRSVWDAYKGFSATALRNMTHQEDPWRLAYRGPNEGQKPGIISLDSLREYFEQQPE